MKLPWLLLFPLLAVTLHAQETVSLMESPPKPWTFGNGPEFPGATGSLTVDAEVRHGQAPSLKLTGDFTKGGGYVQTGRPLEKLEIRDLSFWARTLETEKITMRVNDSSGQTHQIVLKLTPGEDWQPITFPLEEFFANRGQAGAVPGVLKYESWGGAKDGSWHGPATDIYFLLGNAGANSVRTLWLSGLEIATKPSAVAGAEMKAVVPILEISGGEHDWNFSLGNEFPGAKGQLGVEGDALKMEGDFSGGGAYVAAIRNLQEIPAQEVTAFTMQLKSANVKAVSVQIVDATGQTHQRKGVAVTGDGEWHEFTLEPAKIAGGEHWGGANDGAWHGPARQMVISLTATSDPEKKMPAMLIKDVKAHVVQPVFAQSAAFKQDFEKPLDWTNSGGVKQDAKAWKGAGALLLSRTENEANMPCESTSPTFPAAPGQWMIRLGTQSALKSPDSSYNAVVNLEVLDAGGQVLETVTLADQFGEHPWQALEKRVELPAQTTAARFKTQLNKTWGEFRLDDLSAAHLAPAPIRDGRITKILFATSELGNLLFPESSREVTVTVETRKPLRETQQTLTWVVRDYWGAEQHKSQTLTLGEPRKDKSNFLYDAKLDLAQVDLENERYYEIHASLPQPGEEDFRNHTSFAILPNAVTHQYKPEEVPFTARNWDNRFEAYVRLTHRLGVRVCGLWGSWSDKPPYKPEAPMLNLVKELGMGWLTTTPIAKIERGSEAYSEEALRTGVRNLLQTYGGHRPLIINLGNEPHGTGERVLKNVAAYKVVYEEVKRIAPEIPVVATSVEPNEEYFKAGYGQWCDAYDFHTYDSYPSVRKAMEDYRKLASKYKVERPIWSTELGLNSQGMTRHAVAVDLIKKTATFFAAGGENMSWFGLLYPDPECKLSGSSTEAHNVFDCRYNRYCPRLDAIAYYHAVNGIGSKRFVEEKTYEGGVNAFLFRDRENQCLQILWKDGGRVDTLIPLPGVKTADIIRIDGSRRSFEPGGKGLTLSLSDDPILLLYEGTEPLAGKLGEPFAQLANVPESVSRQTAPSLLGNAKAGYSAILIPRYADPGVKPAGDAVFTSPKPDSAIREAEFLAPIFNETGQVVGELSCRAPVR